VRASRSSWRRGVPAGAAIALGIMLAVPSRSPARTPPSPVERSKAYYEQGVKDYDGGRCQDAITEFQQAYDVQPDPILLYNIGHSYLCLGNKEQARTFYVRYLKEAEKVAPAADAPKPDSVRRRIDELAQSLEQEKKDAARAAVTPDGAARDPRPKGETTAIESHPTPAPIPSVPRWTVAACAAPSFAKVSGRTIDLPVLFALRIGGGYAFPLRSARLTVGVDGSLALLPYQTTDAAPSKSTSTLAGVLATARYLRELTPGMSVGGGLGVGVVWWSGLGARNPFADADIAVAGSIPMPTLQAGLQATFDLGGELFVVAAPELLYSKATSGLDQSLSGLWRFNANVGLGYRF
jgi:tetratricopeptide (TPR) repeat protein